MFNHSYFALKYPINHYAKNSNTERAKAFTYESYRFAVRITAVYERKAERSAIWIYRKHADLPLVSLYKSLITHCVTIFIHTCTDRARIHSTTRLLQHQWRKYRVFHSYNLTGITQAFNKAITLIRTSHWWMNINRLVYIALKTQLALHMGHALT